MTLNQPESEEPLRLWGPGAIRGAAITCATVVAALCCSAWNSLDSGGHGLDFAVRHQIQKPEEAVAFYAAKHRGKHPARLVEARKHMPDGQAPLNLWGNPFIYNREEAGYLIMSLGADGKPGGEGEDPDIRSGADRSAPTPRPAILRHRLMSAYMPENERHSGEDSIRAAS